MSLRTLVALGVAAVALAGLAGCSSSSSASGDVPFKVSGTPVRTDRVDLVKTYKFSPTVIEVKAGTTVTWTNHDDFPHNVTLLDGSETSEDLPIGESATITFDESGEFPYECSLHPQQMQGRVVVI